MASNLKAGILSYASIDVGKDTSLVVYRMANWN